MGSDSKRKQQVESESLADRSHSHKSRQASRKVGQTISRDKGEQANQQKWEEKKKKTGLL